MEMIFYFFIFYVNIIELKHLKFDLSSVEGCYIFMSQSQNY